MNATVPGLGAKGSVDAGQQVEIPLVKGGDGMRDSADCVLQMIADLRSYHRRRIFSHQERFGVPDPYSEQALDELSRAHASATRLIEEARGGALELRLEPTLKVAVTASRASEGAAR